MRKRLTVLVLSALVILTLVPIAVTALPGEVIDEHKISDTTGGFQGLLLDSDQFGVASVGIGDLDGDGVEDLAIGAWGDDDGGPGRGAIWIVFLNADGTVKNEQKISQTSGGFGGTLTDTATFGGSIALLGDLDGDGVVDLAVSAHNDDANGANHGAVWILFLNTNGTVKDEQRIDEVTGGFDGVLDDGDFFGKGLSAIGDLDDSGTTELAVGASSDDDGTVDAGAVWILFLLPDGTVHHHQKISATTGNLGASFDVFDRFGIATAGLGDLDGDGVPDIAVAADRDDDGGLDRGSVYILFLEHDGSVKASQKISQTAGGFNGVLADVDLFGFGIAAVGDLDGDGIADLGVGALGDNDNGSDHGAVWILFLNTDGTVSGHQKISDLAGNFQGVVGADRFGVSLGGIGDLDGDKLGDLVVGAYFNDDGGTNRGAVWILELDSEGLVCGNGVLDPSETCDDGAITNSDGCSATCEIEDDLQLFGIAENVGLLSVDVNQLSVNVSVLTGDTPSLLAQLLAIAINGNPALMTLGTTALPSANTVTTNGTFNAGQILADGTSVSVSPGSVVSEQKISFTQGGFLGLLDDIDLFGSSIAALGDLDGDGIGDLVVGAQRDDDGGTDRGAIWVLFLNADQTVKSHQKISDTEGSFTGVVADNTQFGASVTMVGDIDGDGVGDLAVGVPFDSDGGTFRGAVWILFLNTDGTVKGQQKISDIHGGFTGALTDGVLFGWSTASLGDIDGDGIADLAVGSVTDEDGGSGRGAVWILFLNVDGTVKGHQKISDTQGGFTGILDDQDALGNSVTSMGDVDGDGVVDLAVGATGDDDGGASHGAVWILFLNSNGTVKSHQKISDTQGGFTGAIDFDAFGSSVSSVGDLDGNGIADLAIGAPGDSDGGAGSPGAIWVLFLNSDGSVKSHRKVAVDQGGFAGSLNSSDAFGSSMASLGDLDEDGISDFAVGADGSNDGGNNRGAVWMLSLDGAVLSYCGDGVVIAPETCDDSNLSPGDGCYSTCEVEDEIEFVGTAQGGTLQVVVSGVAVLIGTSAGQSASTLANNLSSVINIVPDLESLDVSSAAISSRVVSNGTFDGVVIMDSGITLVPEPSVSASLGLGAILLHVLDMRRRRRVHR